MIILHSLKSKFYKLVEINFASSMDHKGPWDFESPLYIYEYRYQTIICSYLATEVPQTKLHVVGSSIWSWRAKAACSLALNYLKKENIQFSSATYWPEWGEWVKYLDLIKSVGFCCLKAYSVSSPVYYPKVPAETQYFLFYFFCLLGGFSPYFTLFAFFQSYF